MNWVPILASGLLPGLLSALVLFLIYRLEKHDNRREVRARLSMAYMTYHAEILKSETSRRVVRELFYRDFSPEDAEKLVFMYMLLNAVYLEWNFTLHFGHPREAFRRSISGMFGRFARDPSPASKFLLDRFHELFFDFPEDFRNEVLRQGVSDAAAKRRWWNFRRS
jgi:hypothetical protein